jgi:fucose permease
MPVTPSTTASGAAPQKTPWGAVLLFCLLFFIFGFVTWLNGPLITFAQVAFNVSDSVALLVPSVFYLSYFFLSIPAAVLLKKIGMKRGMAAGLVVMAIGAACFAQFASARQFAGTLTSLFIIGGGLSILQTAANPYISVLGPIDSAAQRIAVLGLFNKGAGFLAPIIVGTLILHGIGDLASQVEAAANDPAARDVILNAFAARIHMRWPSSSGFPPCRRSATTPIPIRARARNSPTSRCSLASWPSSPMSAPRLWQVTPYRPMAAASACRWT